MKPSQRYRLNRLAELLVTRERYERSFSGFAAAQRSNPEIRRLIREQKTRIKERR